MNRVVSSSLATSCSRRRRGEQPSRWSASSSPSRKWITSSGRSRRRLPGSVSYSYQEMNTPARRSSGVVIGCTRVGESGHSSTTLPPAGSPARTFSR